MGKYKKFEEFVKKYEQKYDVLIALSCVILFILTCTNHLVSSCVMCTASVPNVEEASPGTELPPTSQNLNTENSTPDPSSDESMVVAPPAQQTPCFPVIIWPNALFDPISQEIILEWYGDKYDSVLGEIGATAVNSCNTGHFPEGELCGKILKIREKSFDLATMQNQINGTLPGLDSLLQRARRIYESETDDVMAWKTWNRLQKEELTLPRELYGISINDPTLGFHWLKDMGGKLAWSIFTPYHFASTIPEIRKGVVTTVGYSENPSLFYCLQADFPHFSVPVSGIMSRMIWDMKVSFPENLPVGEADYGWFVPHHLRRIIGEKFYSFLLNTAFHSPRLTSGVGAVTRQLLAQILEEIPQYNKGSLRMELGQIYCAATVGDEKFENNTLLQSIFSSDEESWVTEHGHYVAFFARRIARGAFSSALLPADEINVRLEVVREMRRQIGLAIEEVGDVPPRCAQGEVVTVNPSSVELTASPSSVQEDPSKTSLPETQAKPNTDVQDPQN